MRGPIRLACVWVVVAVVLLVMLVLGGALAWAAPPEQKDATLTPTATSTVPPLPSPSAGVDPADPDVAALAAAAHEENLDWGNITIWPQGLLGDPDLAYLGAGFSVGQELADFVVPTLDGGVFVLAKLTGSHLLNFWASWCGPCDLELPLLLEAHADAAAPFEVVLINVWDSQADYESYAAARIPPTLVTGRAPQELADQLSIQAIPVSILLEDRWVEAVHIGNLTPAVMDLLYELAGSAGAVVEAPPAAPDEARLSELAQAVERANRAAGAATLWRGGMLGVASSDRLAVQVGDKLPAFGLMTGQGQVFRLDMVEEPYLLNFWASWCGPCASEFPLLVDRHGDPATPYRIAFVNIWDDPYTAAQFLAAYPPDILSMIDAAGDLPDLYGIRFIPVSILVDAEGTVQMIQLGPVSQAVLDFAGALVGSY